MPPSLCREAGGDRRGRAPGAGPVVALKPSGFVIETVYCHVMKQQERFKLLLLLWSSGFLHEPSLPNSRQTVFPKVSVPAGSGRGGGLETRPA